MAYRYLGVCLNLNPDTKSNRVLSNTKHMEPSTDIINKQMECLKGREKQRSKNE